jgi:hypothetical protein
MHRRLEVYADSLTRRLERDPQTPSGR